MAATDTTTHVVQAETAEQFSAAVAQLDAYTAASREPPLLERVDDAAAQRITYKQVVTLDLGA